MEKNLVCSECGGTMQVGYIPDRSSSWIRRSFWVSGYSKPIKGFLENILAVAKMTKYYIMAYRCEKCGYVKMYAERDRSEELREI